MLEDALLSMSLDFELLTDEADTEVDDELLEKTLWGRCFIRATKVLARCRARLRLLSCGASPPAAVAPLPLTPPAVFSFLLPSPSNPLDVLRPSAGDCLSSFFVGGDGDLEVEIHECFA